MKIEKYKKLKNGMYELELDNSLCLETYEDTILKFELLIKKNIDDNTLFLVKENDKDLEVYYKALKFIRFKARTIKEVKDKLYKDNYPKEYIENAVCKLINQGYLDDLVYTKSYIHMQMVSTSWGPGKIKKELIKKGVDLDIIDSEIDEYTDEEQLNKIKKLVKIKVKGNRSRSVIMLKNKIINDLYEQGFSKYLIEIVFDETDFGDDSDIAKKEYEKLYKKLSRKFTGEELEFEIKKKLYQKGLNYSKEK